MAKRFLTFRELKGINRNWLEKEQNRRFQAMMRHCYYNHAFIRGLLKERNLDFMDFQEIDDWQRKGLPLIRKVDYLNDPRAFLINPQQDWNTPEDQIKHLKAFYDAMGCYPEQSKFLFRNGLKYILTRKRSKPIYEKIKAHAARFYFPYTPLFSGGRTTGNPSACFLTRSDMEVLQNNSANIGRLVWEPFEKRDIKLVAMNLFPALPHLGFWGVHLGFDAMATVNLPTSPGLLPTEKLVTIAETFKANGLAGIPSFIRNRFLDVAREKKIKFADKGAVLLAGERIYKQTREDIETGFMELGMEECNVIGGYASSETKHTFFGECQYQSGYHNLGPLSLTFRTVKLNDPTGQDMTDYEFTSPEEGGLMTIFHLDGTGTIFEGYLQGDYIEKVIDDPCPNCGVRTRGLYDISRSHESDFQLQVMGILETKVKGATVNLTHLREMLLGIPGLREVQLVIDKENQDLQARDILIVRASKEKDVVDTALHDRIRELTKVEAEVTPHIEIIEHEDLLNEVEALKFAWIQDLRTRYEE
ncbi:MAG: phenylacetate--CoA ligase family protein [Promethearchaeota archaeon]